LVHQVAIWHIFGILAPYLVIFGMFGTFVTFGTPMTFGTVMLVTVLSALGIIPSEFWCTLVHVTFGTSVGTLTGSGITVMILSSDNL